MKTGETVSDTVPKLVERCRQFDRSVLVPHEVGDHCAVALSLGEWNRLGIRESINLPEDRR